jgi:prepilin-type processing-associated H-X9-DG protein
MSELGAKEIVNLLTGERLGLVGDTDLVLDENDGGPTFMALNATSDHPGGVNVLFADGSVHFIKSSIAGATWRALGTISGGEIISSNQY